MIGADFSLQDPISDKCSALTEFGCCPVCVSRRNYGIMQGVEPSAHEPVHKHEDDRRRVKLVQGVTACDRVNARRNLIKKRCEAELTTE